MKKIARNNNDLFKNNSNKIKDMPVISMIIII